MKGISSTNQMREHWDKTTESDDLRNEWICDRNVTDEQCLAAILPHLRPGKILDLGCGIGRLTQGYGVDISPRMLALAKDGNKYVLGDGYHIPYENDFFDNVFSVLMFQHIPDEVKANYIRETHRVLKPKGVFRLQFVEGDEQADFHFQTHTEDVSKWMQDAGFEVRQIDKGLIYPEWTWITAIK